MANRCRVTKSAVGICRYGWTSAEKLRNDDVLVKWSETTCVQNSILYNFVFRVFRSWEMSGLLSHGYPGVGINEVRHPDNTPRDSLRNAQKSICRWNLQWVSVQQCYEICKLVVKFGKVCENKSCSEFDSLQLLFFEIFHSGI